MNVEYINPFIEASQTVVKQIAGFGVSLGKVYLKESTYKSDSVMVMVGMTGKMRGHVSFVMNRELAMMVASKMMGGFVVEEFDELAKSAISEMANMILGNTATILYNRGISIEITPPSILIGDNIQVSPSRMKTVCVPLKFENDMIMNIDISLEEEK